MGEHAKICWYVCELYCHALANIRYSDAWCIPPGDYHVYGTASKACRHATARTFPTIRAPENG
jgi:hypothetical protein